MLCHSPAWEPRTTGMQCQEYGRVPNWVGIPIASSTAHPQKAPSRQGRSGPYGQHGKLCVYQPAIRLRSRRMSQLAHHLLIWSQKHLRSLPAIHIPGVFYSLSEARSGTDTVQDQGGRGASPVSGSILAQQDLVPGNSISS